MVAGSAMRHTAAWGESHVSRPGTGGWPPLPSSLTTSRLAVSVGTSGTTVTVAWSTAWAKLSLKPIGSAVTAIVIGSAGTVRLPPTAVPVTRSTCATCSVSVVGWSQHSAT